MKEKLTDEKQHEAGSGNADMNLSLHKLHLSRQEGVRKSKKNSLNLCFSNTLACAMNQSVAPTLGESVTLLC